jgi:hypothetical protein
MYQPSGSLGRHRGDYTSAIVVVQKNSSLSTKKKVLKITIEKPPLDVLPILEQLWKGNDTVHLTKTRPIGQIPVQATGVYLKTNDMHGFVKEPRKGQTPKRWAYVYKMPLMLGDLKDLKDKGLLEEEQLAAIEIQRLAIECLLNQYGIFPDDLKDINVLYRELTSEDRYRGKKLCKADYWQYHIGSRIYYVPTNGMKYLIQLCDYDKWRRIHGYVRDFSEVIEERFALNPRIREIFKKFEQRPPEGLKIRVVN